jgi:hypothetical protein
VEHLFLHCPFAQACWSLFNLQIIQADHDLHESSTKYFFLHGHHHHLKPEYLISRNKLIFEGHQPQLNSVKKASKSLKAHSAQRCALWLRQGTQRFYGTTTDPANLVRPPHQSYSWLGRHNRPNSVLALRLNQGTIHDFALLFLPPCGTHLIPSSIRSLEPRLLVSPHLEAHRHRPFALVLHLHQCKSSHNQHLQY